MKSTIVAQPAPQSESQDRSIGRIVSVTGAKAIVLLDGMVSEDKRSRGRAERPEMGTLFAIQTRWNTRPAIVSALSVPVPAQREGESELWIAELGLVGELWKPADGRGITFNRGVSVYPALGDRVRVASRQELEQAFCGDRRNSVRVGCIRQDPSIPASVRGDDLLGKHFAIVGTTGTGKSCTTALILRAILQKHPAAHMVLLDPHNEYAPAFDGNRRNSSANATCSCPIALTFEELIEVLPAIRRSARPRSSCCRTLSRWPRRATAPAAATRARRACGGAQTSSTRSNTMQPEQQEHRRIAPCT